eukprot:8382738-Lingulodinium_polyedra.AAC.1
MLRALEEDAAKKAKALGKEVVPASRLAKAFTDQAFAKATDWVVEIFPGVHLRCSCNTCHEFP